jgi:hypothetical protein
LAQTPLVIIRVQAALFRHLQNLSGFGLSFNYHSPRPGCTLPICKTHHLSACSCSRRCWSFFHRLSQRFLRGSPDGSGGQSLDTFRLLARNEPRCARVRISGPKSLVQVLEPPKGPEDKRPHPARIQPGSSFTLRMIAAPTHA